VLPLLTVVIIIPIWLSGLESLDSITQGTKSYIGIGEDEFGGFYIELAVGLAVIVFICGFIRSMYTIVLLDKGDWWELKYFSDAHKQAHSKWYYGEIGLRVLVASSFIVHQSSINQLNIIPELEQGTLQSIPNSIYSIGAMFGFNDISFSDRAITEVYEELWFNAAISGYIVFFCILSWTVLAHRVIHLYLERCYGDGSDTYKSALRNLKKQKRTQVWAFILGILVTTWILIFSQIHHELFNKHEAQKFEVLAIFSIIGIAAAFVMIGRVFLPQMWANVKKIYTDAMKLKDKYDRSRAARHTR